MYRCRANKCRGPFRFRIAAHLARLPSLGRANTFPRANWQSSLTFVLWVPCSPFAACAPLARAILAHFLVAVLATLVVPFWHIVCCCFGNFVYSVLEYSILEYSLLMSYGSLSVVLRSFFPYFRLLLFSQLWLCRFGTFAVAVLATSFIPCWNICDFELIL